MQFLKVGTHLLPSSLTSFHLLTWLVNPNITVNGIPKHHEYLTLFLTLNNSFSGYDIMTEKSIYIIAPTFDYHHLGRLPCDQKSNLYNVSILTMLITLLKHLDGKNTMLNDFHWVWSLNIKEKQCYVSIHLWLFTLCDSIGVSKLLFRYQD